MALLEIRDLSVRFHTHDAEVDAVSDVSLTVQPGETLGIVGESGSGKSQLAFAVMGLLARNGRAFGSVRLEGDDDLTMRAVGAGIEGGPSAQPKRSSAISAKSVGSPPATPRSSRHGKGRQEPSTSPLPVL